MLVWIIKFKSGPVITFNTEAHVALHKTLLWDWKGKWRDKHWFLKCLKKSHNSLIRHTLWVKNRQMIQTHHQRRCVDSRKAYENTLPVIKSSGRCKWSHEHSIAGDVPKIHPTAPTPGRGWATDKPHAAGGSAAPTHSPWPFPTEVGVLTTAPALLLGAISQRNDSLAHRHHMLMLTAVCAQWPNPGNNSKRLLLVSDKQTGLYVQQNAALEF